MFVPAGRVRHHLTARYEKSKTLLRQGKLEEALKEADAGMRAENSWRFRILRSDILLARSDAKGAKDLLASADPPTDQELLAHLRMNQGWAENLDSNYANAEALLQQAAQIVQPLNLPSLQAVVEMRLGNVQVKQGRLELGERSLRHVVEVTGSQNDLNLQATAMNNLGLVFLNAFQLEEAVYWFERASAVFRQLGSMHSYYVTLGNLGSCYQNLGDSEKALSYFAQAEAHAHQIGDLYGEQLWIGNSGDVLSDSGDLPRAAAKFKQALAIATVRDKDEKDLTSWWVYSLASISLEQGDYDAAEKYNQEAMRLKLAIADHSDYYPRLNEARIAAGRREPRAEEMFRDLVDKYHYGMNPVEMVEARAGLATLLAGKGEFAQADSQFRQALSHLESQRTALVRPDDRMTYLSRLIRFYDQYINFLVDQKQTDRALEVAESSRARVLDEVLESKTAHASVSAARIKELARASHTEFLSYWLGKKRSFLWTVTGENVTLYQLPPESQITPLVAGYRSFLENLRDPMQAEYPAGRKLAEMLLRPALPLPARVVIVPDRSLHALNFETLPDPEDPKKYLIERAAFEVAPSLSLLAEARPAAHPPDSLLLIGNPEQAVEEYPTLPFAASEVNQISAAFTQKKQTVLRGAEAYPMAYREVRPSQFSWIHFAAHAAANRGVPLDSALILSRNGPSYQLLARDVMSIPLNATLVTLSACRGAGAKTYSGEGQVGLSWAFLRAGARSVVAGLWDVTDKSTADLMADFYQQLAKNVAPVDALRHAKLALLHGGKVYQKPFYWGPFQLYAGSL